MKNCLVTKLKSAVNNDSLERLGALEVKVATKNWISTIALYKCYITDGSDASVSILGDNAVVFNSSVGWTRSDDNKEITSNPGTATSHYFDIDPSNVDYVTLRCYNKYCIRTLDNVVDLDVNMLKSCANIEYLKVVEGIHKTSTDTIVKYIPLVSDLYIGSTSRVQFNNIAGQFSDFAKLEHLDYLFISNVIFDEVDSIERFVAVKRGLGHTASTGNGIRIRIDQQQLATAWVTFQGNRVHNPYTSNTLSWTASTITFEGTTINNSDVVTP